MTRGADCPQWRVVPRTGGGFDIRDERAWNVVVVITVTPDDARELARLLVDAASRSR